MKKIIYNSKNDTFSIIHDSIITTIDRTNPEYKKLKLQSSTIPGLIEINNKEPLTQTHKPITSEIDKEEYIKQPDVSYIDKNTISPDNEEELILNTNINELKAYSWEIRQERDAKILSIRWIIDRHRDQLDNNETPSLTDQDYRAILNYIRSLRNLTQHKGFPWKGLRDPKKIPWPLKPKILVKILEKNKENNTI